METASQPAVRDFPAPYNQSVELLKETTRPLIAGDRSSVGQSGASGRHWLALSLAQGMAAWHLASLDAPTVAVVWCEALARIVGVHLPLWVPIALGLGTWAIYLGDRLMDAKRALAPLRERHWFHWRHRAILTPIAAISLLTALVLVLREMPAAIRERNSALALAALVYFAAIHSRRSGTGTTQSSSLGWQRIFTKETFVGLIFALVCAAPAATRSTHGLALLVAPVAACFLLAWLNCWLIEHWDSGVSVGVRLPLALSGLTLGAAALAFVFAAHTAAAFLAALSLSALLLAWLDRKRDRLNALHLRAAADLVLLTPLLILAPSVLLLLLRGAR